VEIDGRLGDTEPNSLSILSLFLFEPPSLSSYLGHDQCETNGRGDASVVLKKKMTKGCWKGQPWTLRERN
jgi:hypothetical protein